MLNRNQHFPVDLVNKLSPVRVQINRRIVNYAWLRIGRGIVNAVSFNLKSQLVFYSLALWFAWCFSFSDYLILDGFFRFLRFLFKNNKKIIIIKKTHSARWVWWSLPARSPVAWHSGHGRWWPSRCPRGRGRGRGGRLLRWGTRSATRGDFFL